MKKILLAVIAVMLIITSCPIMSVFAENQTFEVGTPVEEHPELFLPRSLPTHGDGKIAVFLIEFPDFKNDKPFATAEYYDKVYFSGGSFEGVWADTTVTKFYREQSYGKLNLSGRVFDWYTAKHERSYYDDRKAELVIEAAEHYRSQGVDFSQFDGNGDGIIDAVTYHFAGEYSRNQNDPWYSGVNYSSSGGVGDIAGLKLTSIVQVYNGAEEKDNWVLGTICHELMHSLGMPDLYGSVSFTLQGANDLMSNNLQTINPYTKMLLGWIDNVDIITSDTKSIRLAPYGTKESGRAVIVTDKYNGLFDEFYIVAYREYTSSAVVWHVDARLNEDGRSFMNYNQGFDARPDKNSGHESGKRSSPYPFIEELSSDPRYNYVLSTNAQDEYTSFKSDSVLDPNSAPSSDTHDGRYTGIRMDNFNVHNDKYLTFDVSFVKDTEPPTVTTKEKDLAFNEITTLSFNEYVYEGKSFGDIKITDLGGKPIDATVLIPNYPHHQLEISFKGDAHKDGYKIIIPENALRDSSGNGIAAVILTTAADNLFKPVSEIQLPHIEYNRNNADAHFFNCDGSFVVVTTLWENYVSDAKLEFMRLDYNGNVLKHTIIDNPFVNSHILATVCETSDGSYIFFCNDNGEANKSYLMFCIDKDGNLRWTNDKYKGTGKELFPYEALTVSDGIIIRLSETYAKRSERITVDQKTGEVKPYSGKFADILEHRCFNLPGGKILQYGNTVIKGNGQSYTSISIIDAETLEVLAENELVYDKGQFPVIQDVQLNDDGTMILYCSINKTAGAPKFILLDAMLNEIRSVTFEKADASFAEISFLNGDGFCFVYTLARGDHDNNQFRIYRYDRYLDIVWESAVTANFVYYFRSPTGEILSYKSMWAPERECYIEYYGTESSMRTEHIHKLVYSPESPATVTSYGHGAYWYCPDCGCYYLDEGKTPITNVYSLFTPKLEGSNGKDDPNNKENYENDGIDNDSNSGVDNDSNSGIDNDSNSGVGNDSNSGVGCSGFVGMGSITALALISVCGAALLRRK